nr:hypothetical protein [Kibdelosporangium sp. MJ126-NF4]
MVGRVGRRRHPPGDQQCTDETDDDNADGVKTKTTDKRGLIYRLGGIRSLRHAASSSDRGTGISGTSRHHHSVTTALAVGSLYPDQAK